MTTTSGPEQELRKPGRPRSAQAHKAILDATLELLAEEGFQGLSIEAIAVRARVGKTTIYRRWSSKDELVIDALHEVQVNLSMVDTGNFRNDFVAIFKTTYQGLLIHPYFGQLWLKLVSEFQTNPKIFQAFLAQLSAPRMQLFKHMVEQAQIRGEIRSDIDWTLVMDLIAGPLIYHWMLTRFLEPSTSSFSDAWIDQMFDAVMHGIEKK